MKQEIPSQLNLYIVGSKLHIDIVKLATSEMVSFFDSFLGLGQVEFSPSKLAQFRPKIRLATTCNETVLERRRGKDAAV